MYPDIKQFEPSKWPMLAAGLIQQRIMTRLCEQGRCSVILTGGRSAERLYLAWAELCAFRQMTGVSFYFGDERCVPPDHTESNYGMVMRSLFRRGLPRGCSILRIEADDSDRLGAARRYGDDLPQKVDVMLLGVGEDGHIASLFPGSAALQEKSSQVLPVIAPKPPHERLTITPPVIAKAKSIFVIATGAAKADIYCKAIQDAGDFASLPARLVLNATWLLDSALPAELLQCMSGNAHV